MTSRVIKKAAVKQLKSLLRALLRDGACLVQSAKEGSAGPYYRVIIPAQEGQTLLLEPHETLIAQVIKRGLLQRTKSGWVIGPNGRLALKRLLAGAEPFAEQHQSRSFRRQTINGEKQAVMVNDRSTPLGWLSRRKDAAGEPMISKIQFAAGERLAQDFHFAGMMPRMTSSWSGPGIGGTKRSAPGAGIEVSDNRLAARQRVRTAIEEVGSDLSDILLDICCIQLGLSDAEKARGWPRRSGKLILRFALDRLAVHYGMAPTKQSMTRRSPISHWGDEGYKP